MLIALALGAVLVLMAVGVGSLVTSSLEATISVEARNEAYFAAEGGVELALYDFYRHGPGYEVNDEDGDWGYVGDQVYVKEGDTGDKLGNGAEARWSIRSLAEEVGSEYVIPAPGEGNAGWDCDLRDEWGVNGEDECNWNKINLVTAASVELYRDVSGVAAGPIYEHFQEIKNNGVASNSLQVMMRLPEAWRMSNKYLQETVDGVVENNPTLVSWAFSAMVGDLTMQFLPDMGVEEKNGKNVRTNSNTEITAEVLNVDLDVPLELSLGTHGVSTLSEEGEGDCDVTVATEMFNEGSGSLFETSFQNFKLALIGSLVTEGGEAVPYLEYKIVADREIPDAYVTIESEGVSGDYPWMFKQKIRLRMLQNSRAPVFDFVFIEG